MPDEARKWLDKSKNAAWPDETDIVEAQRIIRHLLAANERLEASVRYQRKSRMFLKDITRTTLDKNKQLEADRTALVALVRVLRKWSYPNADIVAKNDAEARKAWQAISDELREEIEDA